MCQMILTPVIPTSIHPRSAAGIYLPISLCPRRPTSHGTWVVDFDWLHACFSRSISLLPDHFLLFPYRFSISSLIISRPFLVDRGRGFFLLSIEKLAPLDRKFENSTMIFNNRRLRTWAYYIVRLIIINWYLLKIWTRIDGILFKYIYMKR